MNKFSRLLLALIVIALSIGGARAQIPGAENPILWDAKAETVDGRAGEYARILVTTRPESGWHVFQVAGASCASPFRWRLAAWVHFVQ